MEGKKGFCVFKKQIRDAVRVQRDDQGFPLIYSTREQAEREIANHVVSRIVQHFAREDGAASTNTLTLRDYIKEVEVLDDGTVVDSDGNQFGKEA